MAGKRRSTPYAAVLTALITLAAAAGCGPGAATPAQEGPSHTDPITSDTPTAAAAPTPGASRAPAHVVIAVFENKAATRVAGTAQAPYLTSLMSRSAAFTNAHGVSHPSQPNYLALFSGSTQGVTDDHCPVRRQGAANLARQLLDAGHSFAAYSEDLPAPGFTGCASGGYAAKHAPWVDFDNVPAAANRPYADWPADFDQLPTVSFVVPNLCDDMHDCGVATGDHWAMAHLDPYLTWAESHNSLLIVTFDENDGSAGNQILTLVAGAGVTPGARTEAIDHYTVLRTVESLYGLPPLGRAATAAPMVGIGR